MILSWLRIRSESERVAELEVQVRVLQLENELLGELNEALRQQVHALAASSIAVQRGLGVDMEKK